jgi:hypothetical protein
MSDEEFEEEPELDDEDLDEEDLVEDFDEEDDDDDVVDELLVEDELEVEAKPDALVAVADDEEDEEELVGTARELEEEEDDVVDLDEELHPDDVEEALDVVLRERTAKVGLEDEEEEDLEPDDRGAEGTKIVPRRPGEFLCSSCFLVLPRHQLADEKRMLCRDCA